MFEPDCPFVDDIEPGGGYRRGKYAERRSYSGFVTHTTGRNVHKRALQWGKTPYEAARQIYRNMSAGPHYLLDWDGSRLCQTCPEELAAWGVGSKNSNFYNNPKWATSKWIRTRMGLRDPSWWLTRFPELRSPFDLACGEIWRGNPGGKPSCNLNVVHVEIIPPPDNGPWPDGLWKRLAQVGDDVLTRRGIALDPQRNLSHSEAHPISRSTRSGLPWDPTNRQWSFKRFEKEVLLARNIS